MPIVVAAMRAVESLSDQSRIATRPKFSAIGKPFGKTIIAPHLKERYAATTTTKIARNARQKPRICSVAMTSAARESKISVLLTDRVEDSAGKRATVMTIVSSLLSRLKAREVQFF